jgi:hypothetical protein
MVCKTYLKNLKDTSKTPPTTSKGATSSPPPKGSEESGHPTPVAILLPYSVTISCYPLQPVPQGRGGHLERIHVPIRLNNLKEIKWDLGSFINDPDWYIQAFVTVIQTFDLACKDVMLLLDQTLTSLEWQRVLDQVTQVGNDYYLQKSSVKPAPLEGETKDPGVLTCSSQDESLK